MRKNGHGIYAGRTNGSVDLEQCAGKQGPQLRLLARPRVILRVLVPVIFILPAVVSLLAVQNVYAESNCLLICPPTPTPSPTAPATPSPTASTKPSPTPKAKPTPTPKAKPTSEPTAIETVTPIATTSPATAAPTQVAPTPAGNSVGTSFQTPKRGDGQVNNGGMFSIAVFTIGAFLFLFLCVVLGWLFVRRALVPRTGGELPPSGALPWSRFRVPNPNSLIPTSNEVSMPTHSSDYWDYDISNGAPAHFLSNSEASQQQVAPDSPRQLFLEDQTTSLLDDDTSKISSMSGRISSDQGSLEFSSGPWRAQQHTVLDTSRQVFSDAEGLALEDDDTLRFPSLSQLPAPDHELSNNPFALSQGGAPSSPGTVMRKKTRGLITKAPYYSSLAPTDENDGIF